MFRAAFQFSAPILNPKFRLFFLPISTFFFQVLFLFQSYFCEFCVFSTHFSKLFPVYGICLVLGHANTTPRGLHFYPTPYIPLNLFPYPLKNLCISIPFLIQTRSFVTIHFIFPFPTSDLCPTSDVKSTSYFARP